MALRPDQELSIPFSKLVITEAEFEKMQEELGLPRKRTPTAEIDPRLRESLTKIIGVMAKMLADINPPRKRFAKSNGTPNIQGLVDGIQAAAAKFGVSQERLSESNVKKKTR